MVRLHPWTRVKTQNWNMVYVPYCTGDIYSGDKVAVYDDPQGQQQPLVWHHNGLRNMRAVVGWLKDNLPRPTQMLTTGCSAGGAGSLTNYANLRQDMAPSRGYLINDSGPVYTALAGTTSAIRPIRCKPSFVRPGAWMPSRDHCSTCRRACPASTGATWAASTRRSRATCRVIAWAIRTSGRT